MKRRMLPVAQNWTSRPYLKRFTPVVIFCLPGTYPGDYAKWARLVVAIGTSSRHPYYVDMDFTAHVPADIEDLIPRYRQRRRREVTELHAAAAERDMDKLVHLGERMFAVGNPYGFRQITILGRKIRDACSLGDFQAITEVIKEYERYLLEVVISVVEAPSQRLAWSQDRRVVAAGGANKMLVPKSTAKRKTSHR